MGKPDRESEKTNGEMDIAGDSNYSSIAVSESEYHWLEARLVEPPRLLPALKALADCRSVFEV
jgi:hypothetical protein